MAMQHSFEIISIQTASLRFYMAYLDKTSHFYLPMGIRGSVFLLPHRQLILIFCSDTKIQSNCQVSISMFELYNEKVRDLFTIPKAQSDFLKVVETAEEGFCVQNGQVRKICIC